MKMFPSMRRCTPMVCIGVSLLGFAGGAVLPDVAYAQSGVEAAERSKIAPISLPAGGFRSTGKEDNAKFHEALNGIAKQNGGKVGDVEVIVWQGGDGPKKALGELLQKAGFKYAAEPGGEIDGSQVTVFAAADANRKGFLGLWMQEKEMILLAWGTLLSAGGNAAQPNTPAEPATGTPAQTPAATTASGDPISVTVPAGTNHVNVMKGINPPIPTFKKLDKQANKVRGYVLDTRGKPVAGARLGIRSTAVGGFYSGAQGKTDENGYYEIDVPFGVAHFYNAGYAIDYGEGRAALGLHPADGELDSLAGNVGAVENFVLLPFGIADRDGIQDQPQYLNNYYGGSIILSYSLDEGGIFSSPSYLPPNSVIEVTLTPQGPLFDGSPARPIVIRKETGTISFGQLYVNNIPVTTYTVEAKLVGGGALKMKEVGPNGGRSFGIEPKQATGKAALLLRPSSAKAEMTTAAHGGWDQISIQLER